MSQNTVILGRTGLVVPKNGFGALPIQRISYEESAQLIRKALDNGMYYFDTARFYTDSEEKLGKALKGRRKETIISTKTGATTVESFWNDLHTSLRLLQTDYIDLYQFHNPAFCPLPGDESGLYEAMEEAQRQGKILHIGITNHRLAVAQKAIESGCYETLQFPFSYLTSEKELDLVMRCKSKNIGYIAMKALAGGLINHAATAYAYLAQYDHVVPIWGIQRMSELDEFIEFQSQPTTLDASMQERIDHDREELKGNFCRGCGYCLPCTANINIPDCNRMYLLLRRAPYKVYLTDNFNQQMMQIEQCVHCDLCKQRCPYGLDIPTTLQQNLQDWKAHWSHREDYQ